MIRGLWETVGVLVALYALGMVVAAVSFVREMVWPRGYRRVR